MPRKHSLHIDVVLRLRVAEPGVFEYFSGASCGAQSVLGLLDEKGIDDVREFVGMGDADLVRDFNLGVSDLLVLASLVPVVERQYACE